MMKTLFFSLVLTVGLFSQTWVPQTVDDNSGKGGLGDYTSISTDINNNPNITYREVGVQFKYAHWVGAWTLETIDFANSGRWTVDVGMDKYDLIPHITYGDNSTGAIYHYARAGTGSWTPETVSTGSTGFTADMTRMKLDADNNIHLICTDNSSPYKMKYFNGVGISYTNKTWTSTDVCTNVDSKSINLVMDNNKQPNIVFDEQSTKKPWYGYRTAGGVWQIAALNTDAVGSMRVGIAVDKNNLVHIAYITTAGALKYMSGSWGAFSTAITIASGLGNNGHVAIATNSKNVPYIAYYTGAAKTLKCANYTNSTWTLEDVDVTPGADVGQYCSIAIGTNDIPQIAYYDKTNTTLKYAKIVMPPPPAKTLDVRLTNNLFKPKAGEYMNIQYTINVDGIVVIRIYSLSGDLVKEVKNGTVLAGTYIERWDGDYKTGATAASGTYMVTTTYEGNKITKKAVLVK